MSNIKSNIVALIMAAGSGVRCGSDRPKQYCNVAGRPLLRWTLDQFIKHDGIDKVHCVIHPDAAEHYKEAVDGLTLAKPIIGGTTRQESVKNALRYLKDNEREPDIVLIHDAARPFVNCSDINLCIDALHNGALDGVSMSTPVTDTICEVSGDGVLKSQLNRNQLRALQTPQAFNFDVLYNAHLQTKRNNHTDDTSLLHEFGYNVSLVQGRIENVKITTETDLKRAEQLLSKG